MSSNKEKLLKASDRQRKKQAVESLPPESISITENAGTDTELRILSHVEKTEDEVIAESGLDRKRWCLVEKKKWCTTLKLRRAGEEQAVSVWNYAFKFKVRANPAILDAADWILAEWQPPKLPPANRRRKATDHLWILALYDAHFGKIAREIVTDDITYDLPAAARDYRDTIVALCDRMQHCAPERIVLPIGQDFFHVDNFDLETSNRTRVEATSDHLTKMFQVGFDAVAQSVEYLRSICPQIELTYVPGNHDRQMSWHLCHSLAMRFKNDKAVQVDLVPDFRKTIIWGDCILVLTHGEKMKAEKIVLTAAAEIPGFSDGKFREVLCGHRHTRQGYAFATEHSGVLVRYLPSLSRPDDWHHSKGYVGNLRGSSGFVYSRTDGPILEASAYLPG